MGLLVDICFFLNLPDQNVKLFCFDVQNNFMFRSGKFSQIKVKTQKSTNNRMSSFGLIEKYGAVSYLLSCTYQLLIYCLDVPQPLHSFHLHILQIEHQPFFPPNCNLKFNSRILSSGCLAFIA